MLRKNYSGIGWVETGNEVTSSIVSQARNDGGPVLGGDTETELKFTLHKDRLLFTIVLKKWVIK